ncbi:hypothetical protein K457DRAFT_18466 [Linnemannia elongata AG-77]|uniref:Uncharacterized protein n=1 Tax=Linnemannia elongata AG-77 TaxID=1314771 RepID=A0A197JXR2_9FUNG|nr:hypothetical protein K457DRAFT_18466 [Linnemannia elongata AG-77]
MEDASCQGHGGTDLSGAPKDQQPTTAVAASTTNGTVMQATSSPVLVESSGRSDKIEEHKEGEVIEQGGDTPNASTQQTPEEGGIHQGSKRHKESKHGHYGGEQPPKKQKKRIDLVDPEEDLKNAQYFFDNGK